MMIYCFGRSFSLILALVERFVRALPCKQKKINQYFCRMFYLSHVLKIAKLWYEHIFKMFEMRWGFEKFYDLKNQKNIEMMNCCSGRTFCQSNILQMDQNHTIALVEHSTKATSYKWIKIMLQELFKIIQFPLEKLDWFVSNSCYCRNVGTMAE